jgi:hypothetical protein
MTTYKISKDYWSTLQNFNTLQDCENWVLETLGEGYTITISDEQIPPITPEQKLENDLQFGHFLINQFLTDNRLITPTVTPSESLQLLSEFDNIEKLARLGDINSVIILLNGIVVDDRLFTQERKDKYINQINSYLNNNI